jgi:hypothetical protein
MLDSAAVALCVVSFVDGGMRHTVEVQADSLYEAAVLAVRTFRLHDCDPGPGRELAVEVRSSVTHTITLKKIQDWLNGGAKSPKEAVLKERLRELL